MKDDRVYLNHILECIERIINHRRVGHKRFLESDTVQDAVLRNLQTMADSTQRLSLTLKEPSLKFHGTRLQGFATFSFIIPRC